MARLSLRQGLDRDVYQVIKKLEVTNGAGNGDSKPFKTVTAAYDAIKKSNSYLSRSKKRPLEDAIDRVLQFRKEELDDSEDSEAAIEAAEPPPKNPNEDDRFLLNRQMTKHWHADSTGDATRAAKKRRIHDDDDVADEREARANGHDVVSGATTPRPNGIGRDEAASDKATSDKTAAPSQQQQKKTQRPTRFQVERVDEPDALGGIGDIQADLLERMDMALKKPDIWGPRRWQRTPGILLSGPAGVGKRSLVRWLAARLEVPIVSLGPCFRDPERMDKAVVEAIDEALRLAPSILLVEHLDRHMPKPGAAGHTDHHDRVADLLEGQMKRLRQELAPDLHVLAMATTSSVTDINPMATSHDLFQLTVQMRVPDATARADIFRVLTDGSAMAEDVEMAELARLTHGFVGADIKSLIIDAHNRAARRLCRSRNAHITEPDLSSEQPHPLSLSGPDGAVTIDDFRVAAKDFVPSLRKEGFSVIPNVGWDKVGALRKVREQLQMSIIGPIRNPKLYEGWGLQRPAGVILWGPPGCGKTLVAQAVANAAQASFILINGPELLNKYVGESERAVRELFQRARSSTPCILFFDEMDALVPRRDGSSSSGGSDAGVRVVNALLAELDGVQDRSGIYVIGTTNRPDMIDAAMLRPGRLSVRIFVDLPTEDERVDILATIFRGAHPNASAAELGRLEAVARDERCRDYSGADLGGLHTRAAEAGLRRWLAGAKTVQEIEADDWEEALENTTKSVMNPESYRKLNAKLGREK